ncbi:MAG: cobalamin-dependent protein [Proteobacteria bacterium]|nr:cobalamin-dependent protein [Pseudomonadota bacterium]
MQHRPDTELISPRVAARILGVTPSSVKRWANEGRLPCVRTPGGHRRFERHAVYAAKSQIASSDFEAHTANAPSLLALLLTGDADPHAVQSFLLAERARAGSWWRVADSIGVVVHELGARWEAGECSVAEEHMATECLRRGLATCAASLAASPDAPQCVIAAAEGEVHTLGLSLLELALKERAWSVLWVGAPTPTDALLDVLETRKPDWLAVSVSSGSGDARQLADVAKRLGSACREHDVGLVLGGLGPWPEQPDYGYRARTFQELHALLGD